MDMFLPSVPVIALSGWPAVFWVFSAMALALAIAAFGIAAFVSERLLFRKAVHG